MGTVMTFSPWFLGLCRRLANYVVARMPSNQTRNI
jgi:hypothetical protein